MQMKHTVTNSSNDQCTEHLTFTDILKMTAASIVSYLYKNILANNRQEFLFQNLMHHNVIKSSIFI
jgi:hypothetical protein